MSAEDVCIDIFGGGSGPWVWVASGLVWPDDVLLAGACVTGVAPPERVV